MTCACEKGMYWCNVRALPRYHQWLSKLCFQTNKTWMLCPSHNEVTAWAGTAA